MIQVIDGVKRLVLPYDNPKWRPSQAELDAVPLWNINAPFMLTRELRLLLDEPTYLWVLAEAERIADEGGGGRAELGPFVRQILSDRAREAGAYDSSQRCEIRTALRSAKRYC
jgi:hypothetical protein